jgi:hypothetical protein
MNAILLICSTCLLSIGELLKGNIDKIWVWILASVVFGTIFALIFTVCHKRKKNDGSDAPNDVELEGDDDDTYDDDEVEGSPARNIVLVVAVFSVIAFLIIWLVMAIIDGGVFS